MFIIHLNVHSECRTSHFTTPNFRPAVLKFMVEYTTRTPNTWVLSGGVAPSRDWLDISWDVGENLVYQTGFICLMPPYNITIWLKYGHTIALTISSPTLGAKSVTNTILYLPQVHWGYHQTLIWSQLAMG